MTFDRSMYFPTPVVTLSTKQNIVLSSSSPCWQCLGLYILRVVVIDVMWFQQQCQQAAGYKTIPSIYLSYPPPNYEVPPPKCTREICNNVHIFWTSLCNKQPSCSSSISGNVRIYECFGKCMCILHELLPASRANKKVNNILWIRMVRWFGSVLCTLPG